MYLFINTQYQMGFTCGGGLPTDEIPFMRLYCSLTIFTIFTLTEANVGEKSLELKRKDGIIAEKEQIIQDKLDIISSLQTEIGSLQVNHLSYYQNLIYQ